ncbi:hypothetical protein GLOTRDRAFT_41137 [Gloeophyllum trabeum ATCC 11539]|uniref:Ubiquitin 3 binding protein But2 C-terminal domain-containing protein n=1 Tax=Gloeophyllum trabeum (strain ATCC 11539 / FP-39264 / Madison 617) TaxID=670483 RepID=S7Q665_GLOTA|nr:uncharacterized protein GLOTRDRAFT_41137 [Gloeophyllum trabeum ATCC 11539]EPQ55546.1 hypothetical protein GLOTRDRAFT_41137 [Gloeophyllum trabeum ATCC 11539]
MGLDKIERAAPPISRQFVNYPFLLTQIDSGRPSYVYSDDPKRHMTFRGYISPEDRQVSVSAQFRALDFGMEDCELSMVVPITREGSNFTLANDESAHTIDIWRLSANTAIDAKRLSYSTRPPRSSKVASADVMMGTSFNHHFHCPQDSVHSFELACAPKSPSCHVEWWQNMEGAFSGEPRRFNPRH